MNLCTTKKNRAILLSALLLPLLLQGSARASSVLGGKPPDGFFKTFGLNETAPDTYSVQEIASNVPADVLWPGDKLTLTYQFSSKEKKDFKADGKVEVISYGSRTDPQDVFSVEYYRIALLSSTPIHVEFPAGGFVNQRVTVDIPEKFGAYGIVIDLDGHERAFGSACVRTPKAIPGSSQYPTFALDAREKSDEELSMFNRLGIKGLRIEMQFSPKSSKNYQKMMDDTAALMDRMKKHGVTVMATVSNNGGAQPLGQFRPLLDDKGVFLKSKTDACAMPESDAEFQEWCKTIAATYGWPKGPLNAMELWNEPWEGSSISGWGADMLRYRDLYTHMAQGIEEARKESGVEVLIGGTCSSMNTDDKLFPDGADTYLKWLDFTSLHYQPMCAMPALIPEFVNRKSPYGPVRVWDTESWIANTEDRVSAVIASMRAQGLSRTAGVFHDTVRHILNIRYKGENNKVEKTTIIQPWAPAAAIASVQQFIGERSFKEVLFQNGLPWIFEFDGLPKADGKPNPDDGTLVVVGDLGGVYERDKLLYRSVMGLSAVARLGDVGKMKAQAHDLHAKAALLKAEIADLKTKIGSDDANAPALKEDLKKRQDDLKELRTQVSAVESSIRTARELDNATMTFPDNNGMFATFDFYGNPVPAQDGKVVVPLNGLGYFVRTNGAPGSFAQLLEAAKKANVQGISPLDIIVHDPVAPIETKPDVRVTLTNILNRPVSGKMEISLGALTLDKSTLPIEFGAQETRNITLKIIGGDAVPSNSYHCKLVFDGGADGKSVHDEDLHVNFIAKRTIQVDGALSDWKDVLPQPMRSSEEPDPNITEKAWRPFDKFDDKVGSGNAVVYMAYDDQNFYFAARISDTTPYDGNVRFGARDDDQYFYPEKSIGPDGKELVWPEGVRRYTYRKNPELPSGDSTDNVQLAFNTIPIEKDSWLQNPPGTPPRFMAYKCTEYEYALNQVAEKFGGGTEIFRLAAPGVPRKHFYPRQPKAPIDGGPVTAGKLVMTREGNTRIVEAALPWSEIPTVQNNIRSGQPVKITVRVNDNSAPGYELAATRSVSRTNTYAMHNYWATHWSNELEFGFEK